LLFRFVLRSLFLYFGFLFCWFSIWLLRKWRKCELRIWTKYCITFHFFSFWFIFGNFEILFTFPGFSRESKRRLCLYFSYIFFCRAGIDLFLTGKKNRISVVITVSCSFLGLIRL
jgi:hypothetical protein